MQAPRQPGRAARDAGPPLHQAQTNAREAARSGDTPGSGGAAPDRRRYAWRRRLERRRRLADHVVPVAGAAAPYAVSAPADADAVLDEMGAAASHMPYWATIWPSGLALAEVALARRAALRGRRVLEVGCGLGITAAAAAEAGAALTVADCFAETLAYCRYNVLRNTGSAPRTLLVDWRTPAGRAALLARGAFDVVLAADVLYEPEDIAPLMELVPRLVAWSGQFWLAEPGRATSERFVEQARGAGWASPPGQHEPLTVERHWPAGAGYGRVRVYTFNFGVPVGVLSGVGRPHVPA